MNNFPPTSLKFAHPSTWKSSTPQQPPLPPPLNFYSPYLTLPVPDNEKKIKGFQKTFWGTTIFKINLPKNFIFSCSHSLCTIFILISYSLYKQVVLILILIDVQYLQNVTVSFENGSHGHTQSSFDFYHLIKSSSRQNFPSPTPECYLENPDSLITLQSYAMSLLLKSNWLVEVTDMLTRLNKRRWHKEHWILIDMVYK